MDATAMHFTRRRYVQVGRRRPWLGPIGRKSFGALTEEVRFTQDSPLEGSGFELLVPGGSKPGDCPLALTLWDVDNFSSRSLYSPPRSAMNYAFARERWAATHTGLPL